MRSTKAVTATGVSGDRTVEARQTARRSVERVLVGGVDLCTVKALGRLLGRYFYIQKASDVTDCAARARGSKGPSAIVVGLGFSGFDALAFEALLRRSRSRIPLFFFGLAHDIDPLSKRVNAEGTFYFKSPIEICKLAKAIVTCTGGTSMAPCLQCPERSPVVRTLQLIEEDYPNITKVSYVSSSLGISREHLSRQFTRCIGFTLWEFVTIYRIERAKELLGQGCLVKQVFREVGFRSESSFFRSFLRHTRTTPKAYREGVLAREPAGETSELSRSSAQKAQAKQGNVPSRAARTHG